MGQVSNKNIILLLRYAVKCVDRSLLDHGSRAAYILYKMLQHKGNLELYEMADYTVFVTLHNTLTNKNKNIEGYRFLKELSPFMKEAKAQLNYYENHTNYESTGSQLDDIAACIFLADWIDTYYVTHGSDFDIDSLRQYEGTHFTKEAWELLEETSKKEKLFDALKDESYLKELDELIEYLVFNNEDEEKYLNMIIYCMGLKSERYALDTTACMCLCEELGLKMYLTQEQRESLKYAALVHDLGMLVLPQELVNESGKLTKNEMEQIEKHVEITEAALRTILPDNIVDIAMAHHERGNGSGYPKKLKARDMNTMQRILQVADMVSALTSDRPYREAKDKKTIQTILREGADNSSLSTEVVNHVIRNYDDIQSKITKKKEQILQVKNSLEKSLQRNGEHNG